MKKWFYTGILLLAACTSDKVVKTADFFDFNGYFKEQIRLLDSLDPAFEKVISMNGEPQDEMSDSLNWNEELEIFLTLDLNKPSMKEKYRTETDSGGDIAIHKITAMDSAMYIQEISTTMVKGEIQLIEAILKKRSFIADRDVRLSYQPLKGYSLRISENYIWNKPQMREIYTQIQGPGHLMK